MQTRISFLAAILLLLIFLACGKDSDNPVSTQQSTDHKKVVQMQDNAFSPKDLVISFGDTVEWVNVGSNAHTSTSGSGCTADGLWDSGLLTTGQKFTVIFDGTHVNQTGSIPYYCIPHCVLNMAGTITVNP